MTKKSRVHQRTLDLLILKIVALGPSTLRDRATPATNIERLLSGPSGLALPALTDLKSRLARSRMERH